MIFTDIPGCAKFGHVTLRFCPAMVTGNDWPPRTPSGIRTMYAGISPGARS